MDVATSVDDSMSFNEAFAAARDEVGAGGLFVWHGNTYGTYYANEWNAMSAEDKEQYWADVSHTTSHLNNEMDTTGDNGANEIADNLDNPTSDIDGTDDVIAEEDDISETEEAEELPEDLDEDIDVADMEELDNDDAVLAEELPEDADEVLADDSLDDATADPTIEELPTDPAEGWAGAEDAGAPATDEIADANNLEEVETGELEEVEITDADMADPSSVGVDPDSGVLHLSGDQINAPLDMDLDGAIDTLEVDVNGNDIPDLVIDTNGDGTFDTLEVDADTVLSDDAVTIPINGVEVGTDADAITVDDTFPADEMPIDDNPDIDVLADNTLDMDIPLENDTDMGEFV